MGAAALSKGYFWIPPNRTIPLEFTFSFMEDERASRSFCFFGKSQRPDIMISMVQPISVFVERETA